MNFSLIVPIPNVSNTGEILKPTEIEIHGEAKDRFNYSFRIYANFNVTPYYCQIHDVTDLYETLLGTSVDVDSRFTEPIDAHLEMLFKQPF